jgi:hypothetical protein
MLHRLKNREREQEMHTEFWLESLKGGDHSENVGLDGRAILKWILGK